MTLTKEESIVIGLAEMQVSKDASIVLTCLGLGSCIGFAAYDPTYRIGGMAHIVLPNSDGRAPKPTPKYADTAIPLLLEEMRKLGASQQRLVVKIAGGALMTTAPGAASLFKTGERNAEATKQILAKLGIRLAASRIGGNQGRTLRLYVGSGKVTVASAGVGTVEI